MTVNMASLPRIYLPHHVVDSHGENSTNKADLVLFDKANDAIYTIQFSVLNDSDVIGKI